MHFVSWQLPWKICTRILLGILFSGKLPLKTALVFLALHVMTRCSMVKKEEKIPKRFCFGEVVKSWRMKQVICFRWRIVYTFNAWWTALTICRRVMHVHSPFALFVYANFSSVSDSMWLIAIRNSLIFIKGRALRMKPDGYQNGWNGFWTKMVTAIVCYIQ